MDKQPLTGIGAFVHDDAVYLLCRGAKTRKKTFHTTKSTDSIHFYFFDDTSAIVKQNRALENLAHCRAVRVAPLNEQYLMTYLRDEKNSTQLCGATSDDGLHWYEVGATKEIDSGVLPLPHGTGDGWYWLFIGGSTLTLARSKSFTTWEWDHQPIHTFPRSQVIELGTAVLTKEEALVFYFSSEKDQQRSWKIQALRFDRANPSVARSEEAVTVWQYHDTWEHEHMTPFAMVMFDNILRSYWQDEKGNIVVLSHPEYFRLLFPHERAVPVGPGLSIDRHHKNPILTPISDHVWESQAVFNAAAIEDRGKVHLVYRAVGNAGVSMFGYAASENGIDFDQRHRHPIYVPSQPFEGAPGHDVCPYPSPYQSGPSWGGCEDPRITKIDGRYYLVYVAFDGWSAPRLAMTSIAEDDFHNKRWHWEKPVLISPPNVVDKSGCILPEKIRGKYVVFHRVFPNILIDYVDSLDFDGKTWIEGQHKIEPRPNHWDSRKIGIGATPIKTDDGWLVIYNSVDDRDDARYKVGAMLLDHEDPSKVIARSNAPILEPVEHYENNLIKYGIVYPCGAVKHNDQLIVYYGGSDAVLCAATAHLPTFMNRLLRHEPSHMELVHSNDYVRISAAYKKHEVRS